MDILDMRNSGDTIFNPIEKVNNKIVFEKIKRVGRMFPDHRVFGYYGYDLGIKKLKRLTSNSHNLYKGVVYNKFIEGEDCIYYVTREREKTKDLYTLYKVKLEGVEKEYPIFNFYIESEYSDIEFEMIDDNYICVFAKKPDNITINPELNFKYDEEEYGYQKGYVFNVDSGEEYEIKDKDFLTGFRQVFFRTELAGEKCIVYEENYLGASLIEDIYNTVYKKKYKYVKTDDIENIEDEFYLKDHLKYTSVEEFIEEIKEGKEKLTFKSIAYKGFDGYEIFSGVDKENIYFVTKDFEKSNEEIAIFLDRKTMKKTMYTIKNDNKPAEDSPNIDNVTDTVEIDYSLVGKNKNIFVYKYMENENYYVKELLRGNVEYTYPNNLGRVKDLIEDRYLITCASSRAQDETINVIDIKENKVKSYKSFFKVIDDTLILF
ncbi:hypothetical protein [Clostridium sp. KNHs214]|uniref:hypothetical protein n=1 Tax=Clostridium sp. KNHs214 TaxID=1540257 RepID=UPI000558DD21|nr:hypothetical protein [Clostridium sp. KNHs214]